MFEVAILVDISYMHESIKSPRWCSNPTMQIKAFALLAKFNTRGIEACYGLEVELPKHCFQGHKFDLN